MAISAWQPKYGVMERAKNVFGDMGYLVHFMDLVYLEEVTNDSRYPNHIYILTPKESLIGYIPRDGDEVHFFSSPYYEFSKTGRKFVKVNINAVVV